MKRVAPYGCVCFLVGSNWDLEERYCVSHPVIHNILWHRRLACTCRGNQLFSFLELLGNHSCNLFYRWFSWGRTIVCPDAFVLHSKISSRSVFDDVWWPIFIYGNTLELHVSVTSILEIKQNKNLSKNWILSILQSSKIMTTYRCRWVFKKKGRKLGKCRHLEAFAKKEVHFSVCLKYILMPRGRIGINIQRKQKAYPCFEKIIYIFCGSFYYCDSFA